MTVIDHQYESLLRKVLTEGAQVPDRTGTGTRKLFGAQLRYDLSNGFPLITTKKVHLKSIVGELIWMLSGSTNAGDLHDMGITIWDEWADDDGYLGPIYGKQWRDWNPVNIDGEEFGGVDQITNLIHGIRANPYGRRHIVTAWNPDDIPDMALPPCHAFFQFDVSPEGKLNCQLYQRSADMFLGVPFNIASYALLTHMVAQQTNLIPGEFIWTSGDTHIYNNHVKQVQMQIARPPFLFPTLELRHRESIFDYTVEDVTVRKYDHWPAIAAPVAV